MNISEETLQILDDNGYDSLEDYLLSLSEDYGIPIETVEVLANLEGEEELFDGLVSLCEDYDIMEF